MKYFLIFTFFLRETIVFVSSQKTSSLATVAMAYMELKYVDGKQIQGVCCVQSCDPNKCIAELQAGFGPLGLTVSFSSVPSGCKSCPLTFSKISDDYPIQDSFEVSWQVYNAITWELIDEHTLSTSTHYAYYTTGGIDTLGKGKHIQMTFYTKLMCLQKYGISCKVDCFETTEMFCDLITGEKYCKNSQYGHLCELTQEPCSLNPCKNKGVCVVRGSSFFCNCQEGFTGTDCNKKACTAASCKNGVCINGLQCKCFEYYEGVSCNTPTCSPNYCSSIGTCSKNNDKLLCTCPSDRAYGSNCEKICPYVCLNGGKCQDASGTPQCRCINGYYGPNCKSRSWDLCSYNQCQNGGECSIVSNTPKCSCGVSGSYWTGKYCEKPTCDLYSCKHGSCVEGKKCSCIMGYSGINCDTITCNDYTLCQHGGTCYTDPDRDGVGCLCDSKRFTGKYCELSCPKSCINGECQLYGGKVMCKCDSSYEGETCNIPKRTSQCDPSPCIHGQCQLNQRLGYSCECEKQWGGRNCDMSTCNPSNCVFGLCVAGMGCECFDGYTGEFCKNVTESALDSTCKKNGYNSVVEGAFTKCSCSSQEATPPLCEIKCSPKCKNGICSLIEGKPGCICNTGYYGNLCDRNSEFPELELLQIIYIALIAFLTLSFIPIIIMIKFFKKRDKRVELENKQFLHPSLVKNMVPDSNKKIEDTYAGMPVQRGGPAGVSLAKKKVTVDVADLAYDF